MLQLEPKCRWIRPAICSTKRPNSYLVSFNYLQLLSTL